MLPRRAATLARAIVFLDMLGSLQNVQSNALVAALIILTFAAYERHHTALGSLAAIAGAYIKLFPLAGVSFAIFHPRKVRVAVAVVARRAAVRAAPAARHVTRAAAGAVRELARDRDGGRDWSAASP